MSSFSVGSSLLSYLNAQTATSNDAASAVSTATTGTSAQANAKLAASAAAALQAAGARPQAALAGHALDQRQAALAVDLRTAMSKSGVKLTGTVEFSVSSAGAVAINASDADKAATTAFLKSDTSKPSFATRIATQARDALKVSAPIQQTAAISQAARQAGNSSGVMSLYTSLLQQSNNTPAVFAMSTTTSSLRYPGSLAVTA